MMMRGVSAAMGWCGRRGFATMFEGIGGIRKAEADILTWSRFSEMLRRNSTTLAASEENSKKEGREYHTGAAASLKKEKSLYLCFWENKRCWSRFAHSIQCIRLSHVLAAATDDGPLELKEEARRSGPDVPHSVLSCVIGSKIVFFDGWVYQAGVRESENLAYEVSEFETDPTVEEKPTLRLSSSPIFKKISKPDPTHPSLLEVDGKVYCLGICYSGPHSRRCLTFQTFDPTQERWLPLDLPPSDPAGNLPELTLAHTVVDTNILLWGRNGFGVSRYDAAHPEKGWTEINSVEVARVIPYLGDAQFLFVKLLKHDHGDDDCYLMFSGDHEFYSMYYYSETPTIEVFLLSHEFESMKPMQPLQLPPLPPYFRCPKEPCNFFHIGGQQVGLVFYEEQTGIPDREVQKVRVAVITFEFEIISTEESSMDVKYKWLGNRYLEYSPDKRSGEKDIGTSSAHLIGAYVL